MITIELLEKTTKEVFKTYTCEDQEEKSLMRRAKQMEELYTRDEPGEYEAVKKEDPKEKEEKELKEECK